MVRVCSDKFACKIRSHHLPTCITRSNVMMILTDLSKEVEKPELHPGKPVMVNVPVHPLLLKITKGVDTYTCAIQANTSGKNLTTRLSPSSFRPVSLRYDTIKGHTPTMFATTLTSSGFDKSWVMMALRKAGREAIQSRVSAPFRRFTMNSVSENGSRLPKTTEAVR